MKLESIPLALYDFLGYLLPGCVLYVALSIVESSFLGQHNFVIANVFEQKLLALVTAYILGHVSHALGSTIANLRFQLPSRGGPAPANQPEEGPAQGAPAQGAPAQEAPAQEAPVQRALAQGTPAQDDTGKPVRRGELSPIVLKRIEDEVRAAYDIPPDVRNGLSKLDIFLLADSFVLTNGVAHERDMFTAREGFFKSSMAAFLVLAIVVILTLAIPSIQSNPNYLIGVHHKTATWLLTVLLLIIARMFWKRFLFFNRAKNNNALVAFLAQRMKNPAADPGAAPPAVPPVALPASPAIPPANPIPQPMDAPDGE